MIKNLKVTDEGIFWEINGVKYRTNKQREGVYLDKDFWYTNQICGNWDFVANQKTASGIRKYINRFFM